MSQACAVESAKRVSPLADRLQGAPLGQLPSREETGVHSARACCMLASDSTVPLARRLRPVARTARSRLASAGSTFLRTPAGIRTPNRSQAAGSNGRADRLWGGPSVRATHRSLEARARTDECRMTARTSADHRRLRTPPARSDRSGTECQLRRQACTSSSSVHSNIWRLDSASDFVRRVQSAGAVSCLAALEAAPASAPTRVVKCQTREWKKVCAEPAARLNELAGPTEWQRT